MLFIVCIPLLYLYTFPKLSIDPLLFGVTITSGSCKIPVVGLESWSVYINLVDPSLLNP
ncbi:MAG: hypothetical protein ACI3VR_04485 [Intestinibacter sp.]|uniref:hypothetical protein n=1 Tax=Intestinibacter sp. TaxID=1965304 RepID=UPI003F145D08